MFEPIAEAREFSPNHFPHVCTRMSFPTLKSRSNAHSNVTINYCLTPTLEHRYGYQDPNDGMPEDENEQNAWAMLRLGSHVWLQI